MSVTGTEFEVQEASLQPVLGLDLEAASRAYAQSARARFSHSPGR
jgi:hypothetical protein